MARRGASEMGADDSSGSKDQLGWSDVALIRDWFETAVNNAPIRLEKPFDVRKAVDEILAKRSRP
jgi:hypothetical protein